MGANQAPREVAANVGPDDPTSGVRAYADATNDLAGHEAGGFVHLTIVATSTAGEFSLTFENTSSMTSYPGVVTSLVWALHDAGPVLFQAGMPASMALERLAEDGNTGPLSTQLGGMAGVLTGVLDTPAGTATPGPLMPGESYTTTLTPDATHRFLSIASMVVPSNDTFVAFDPAGIALLDQSGNPRSDTDIAEDILASLGAWDAGSEANQAGAAGPDKPRGRPRPTPAPPKATDAFGCSTIRSGAIRSSPISFG